MKRTRPHADATPCGTSPDQPWRDRLCFMRRLAAVGLSTYDIAHDLNNVLTGVKGCGGLLEDAIAADDPCAEDLKNLLNYADKGTRIMRGLGDFLRQCGFHRAEISLNQAVEECTRIFGRIGPEGVELETALGSRTPAIQCDPGAIHQIVMELCLNACEAIGGSGRIGIATRDVVVEEDQADYRDSLVPGRFVALEVSDSGAGIAPEVQDRLFQPFNSTKDAGSSAGLGLYFVQRTVRRLGGAVRVERRPEGGTAVTVFVPAASEPSPG